VVFRPLGLLFAIQKGQIMWKVKHILLASHDTAGAHAAEKLAYTFCTTDTTLHHLIVVPDFWKGTMGDDWLNNASTRETFGNYLESQLEQEIRTHVKRMLQETEQRKINYEYEIVQGKPTECLIKRAATGPVDVIVMGSYRPKANTGLNSRMLDESIFRQIHVPLLIAPYPHD
jgi:nucleotide-binding universal stress UspA family protein